METIHLVWFKRDLRINDHRPLVEAVKRGQIVPLYVFEPSFWSSNEYDATHLRFVQQSLIELDRSLQSLGGRLAIRTGELPEILEHIACCWNVATLSSHEETGTWMTYDRDKRVAAWCRERGVHWSEYPQNGVIRKLRDRNGWAGTWARRMAEPIAETPPRISVPDDFEWGTMPEVGRLCNDVSSLGLELDQGGESQAVARLDSFLSGRGIHYRTAMSSPLTAEAACSRLSPYLTWGNVSIRQVKQAVDRQVEQVRIERRFDPEQATPFLASLKSFTSRLSWHCHFIQKLESEPEIEFQNICRVYDGLREEAFDEDRFDAWKEGKTGFPMIDACMRYLHHHRWINFRMRAMLMSFAAYHLWLHWKRPATYLAKHFLDFEPGIHFPQCQMQSGVTGINTLRIYSPVKQLLDQDPKGEFVRRWIPELQHVPLKHLAQPHRMTLGEQSRYRCRIGIDYPGPIVDDRESVKFAKDQLYAIRGTEAAKRAAESVFLKHGSRKRQFRDPLPGQPTAPRRSRRGRRQDDQPYLPGFDDA